MVHQGIRAYGLVIAGAPVGSVIGGLVNAQAVRRIGVLPALMALTANG